MSEVISSIIFYISNAGRVIYRSLGLIGISSENQSSILLLIFVAFIIFVVGFTLGRTRILISIISLYVAYFIEINFSYFSVLHGAVYNIPPYIVHIGLFIIFFIIIFSLFNRSILKSRITLEDSSIIAILILSLINVGLLLSIIISYVPRIGGSIFPDSLISYFGSKNALFYWASASIISVFFLKGRSRSNSSILSSKTRKR